MLGTVTVAVDALMAVLGSPQDTATACFNLLLSIIFYSLSGYLASALTDHRRQGMLGGLVASVFAGLVGTVVLQFTAHRVAWMALPVWMLVGLLLNVPIGAVFGYLGGKMGSQQD